MGYIASIIVVVAVNSVYILLTLTIALVIVVVTIGVFAGGVPTVDVAVGRVVSIDVSTINSRCVDVVVGIRIGVGTVYRAGVSVVCVNATCRIIGLRLRNCGNGYQCCEEYLAFHFYVPQIFTD